MEFNIKQLTNEQLDNLFHGVIYEINVRKAEKQNVDVGFWDSTGEYKESIEEITIQELNENIQPEEKQDEAVILPVNITALQKLVQEDAAAVKELENKFKKAVQSLKDIRIEIEELLMELEELLMELEA